MDSTGRFPRSADGDPGVPAASGGRVKGRDSLFLLAQLLIEGERAPREVRVRNLSAGGLMIELNRVLPEGTAVALLLRGVGEVEGRVVWCTEGRIGVSFDAPIDPLLARKPVGKGARTPAYAKAATG